MPTSAIRVAQRFAAEGNPPEEFMRLLNSHLSIGDRQLRAPRSFLERPGQPAETIFLNYINLPKGLGSEGGGAEAENNRMMFMVEFKGDKVSVSNRVSMLPRELKFRTRTGTSAQVAKYLAEFLNKVAKEVPPNFTHSDPTRYGYPAKA